MRASARSEPARDSAATARPARPHWGRFSTNVLANLGQFLLNIAIGILFIPYLVRELGTAAYGLIPLTLQVTSYLQVATEAMSASIGRFLLIALERNDATEANRVFNTALIGNLVLAVVLLPVGLVLAMNAEHIFRVPAGLVGETRLLFAGTVGMFLLTTVANPFQVSTYCRNRFDLRNAVFVGGTLARIATIVALFTVVTPALWYAGIGSLAYGAVVLAGAIIAWRHLTPELRVEPRRVARRTLHALLGMAGWVVINQVGALLFLSVELLIVNRMQGAVAGGQYAIALQWSTMLRGMARVVAGVFAPTVLALYARHDIEGVVRYMRRAVKLLGLSVALPVGLVCGLSRPLLATWVGHEFVSLAPLMSLMTVHLCVNLAYLPVHTISVATNRVRWPGIASLAMGGGNLALALILAGPAGWGMYGVAAAGAIMLSAKNILFTPLYNAHVLGRGPGTFLPALVPTVTATLVVGGAGWAASSVWDLTGWSRLGGAAALLTAGYAAAVWMLLLDDEERREARAVVRRRLRRAAS